MISLIAALFVPAFSGAAAPTALACQYTVYSCTVVDGHCFGPPPPRNQLGPAAMKGMVPPQDLEAEIQQTIPFNGGTLVLDAKGSAFINHDGTIPQGLTLTDPKSGLVISTSDSSSATLSWSRKGENQWIGVSCQLR